MSIINQLKYYQQDTNIYPTKITSAIDKLINSQSNKKNFEFSFDDFNDLTIEIFDSLTRIINELDKNKCITPKDIIERSDEITIVKQAIQDDLQYEITKRGYSIRVTEDCFKIFQK